MTCDEVSASRDKSIIVCMKNRHEGKIKTVRGSTMYVYNTYYCESRKSPRVTMCLTLQFTAAEATLYRGNGARSRRLVVFIRVFVIVLSNKKDISNGNPSMGSLLFCFVRWTTVRLKKELFSDSINRKLTDYLTPPLPPFTQCLLKYYSVTKSNDNNNI